MNDPQTAGALQNGFVHSLRSTLCRLIKDQLLGYNIFLLLEAEDLGIGFGRCLMTRLLQSRIHALPNEDKEEN